MEATKRRAVIKQNATKKKEIGGQVPVVMGSSKPSTKRKLPEKQGCLPKKRKTVLEPIVGLEAEGRKTITPAKHGAQKGLIKSLSTTQEKPPVLVKEDSKYALEKLSSILTSNDYEDLSNHVTEAMGESGLFYVAQVWHVRPYPFCSILLPPSLTIYFQAMVMMKGLMGLCLNHETALDRIKKRANETEDKLSGLKAWKVGMDEKFAMSETVWKELEQKVESLEKGQADKEKEIKDSKD